AYMQFYDAFAHYFSSGGGKDAESADVETEPEDVVEVREFMSADCDGPPARLWHVALSPSGHAQCLALRPQMQRPGQSGREGESTAPMMYGRVSCDMLRHAEGGFVDLCSDDECSEPGCQRFGIVPE
ncbi:unnamed protein product, partial [Symbiodinium pilosum]